MSTEAEVHVGDVGTVFRMTVLDQDGDVMDLGATTEKKLKFRRSDDTVLIVDAAFYTDGTDGKIQHTSLDGDITISGSWWWMGFIKFAAGEWHTSWRKFTVRDIIA